MTTAPERWPDHTVWSVLSLLLGLASLVAAGLAAFGSVSDRSWRTTAFAVCVAGLVAVVVCSWRHCAIRGLTRANTSGRWKR